MEIESRNNRIQLLPEHLVDQIKAGEVVERPANVIKEIIENSIDAAPSDIKITIDNQGLDLISVEDNGKGMFFEELPYAFCRHATSKITNFEDIYKLNTFGFRGEALASIASIARVSCHSSPKENPLGGGKIIIHGAQTIEHSPFKSDHSGTSLYIKDLFYNTPVRLKFVKSKVSEKNAIKRIINAFIITNPKIKFTVSIDDEDKMVYPIGPSIEQRVESIFFSGKKNKGVSHFENTYLNNLAQVFVSNEGTKGNAGKHQYLFINGRLFTDKKLHQIVVKNLEKFWGWGLSGHYVINLKVPESDIDVNVHPNKTLIKFLNEFEVFSLVSACLKKLIENNSDKIITTTQDNLSFESTSQDQTSSNNFDLWQKIRNEQSNTALSPQNNSLHFGNTNLFSSENQERLDSLGSNIFLLEFESNFYFVNSQICFKNFLNNQLKSDSLELSSLLISEPIDCPVLNKNTDLTSIEQLLKFGFEVDRIDEQSLILRAIPIEIEESEYLNLSKSLILQVMKGFNLDSIDFNIIPCDIELMKIFYQKYGLIELIKMGAAKKIAPIDVKNKFYGKK